jgi:hypothetical protein
VSLVKVVAMTSKLTLSIEKETIEKAKIFSSKSGKGISKIVEEYLNQITSLEDKKESVVTKLSGALKNKIPSNIDWKQTKEDYLRKKHGI